MSKNLSFPFPTSTPIKIARGPFWGRFSDKTYFSRVFMLEFDYKLLKTRFWGGLRPNY